MAGIIDEFIVLFNLDPKKHTAGTKQVLKNQKDLRDDSVKTSREQESQNKRVQESFTTLTRQAAGFVTLLIGANGVKNFVENMINGAAATGRLAANIGLSGRALNNWQYAVKSVGGNAEDANAALQTMANAISNYRLTQHTGSDDAAYSALGFQPSDFKDATTMMLKLADAAQRMDRLQFVNLAHRIGLNDSTINLLVLGRRRIQELREEGDKLYPLTQKQIKAAEDFQAAWNNITTLIQGKAAPLVGKLANEMSKLAGNKESMQIFGDVAVGTMGAIAVAAVAAYGPVIALAAALTASIRLWQVLHGLSPKERKAWEADARAGLRGVIGALENNDPAGAWKIFQRQMEKGLNVLAHGTPDDAAPGTLGSGEVLINKVKRNNPGNIRDGAFAKSQPGYAGASNGFAIFNSMEAGFAAQKRLLQNYMRHGYDTPTKIANRWAPAGDGSNDPKAYASALAHYLGIGVNDRITEAQLDRFLIAQARIEHGSAVAMPKPHAAARTAHSATAALRSRVAAAGGSTTVNLNGDIVIHTQAKDAHQIASSIGPALKKKGIVQQANTGLQ